MFLPYSSDHCIEYRPWLAYVLFPIIVIGAFVFTAEGPIPDTQKMNFVFIEISGLFVLAYMIGTFFVLWTFGKAVCAKTGNCLYLISLIISLTIGGCIILAWSEDKIWILNWLVNCLAGIFLVFCPLNSVDCFIFVPPFRSFSYNGFWAVIVWLFFDIVFCMFLGWTNAAFLHPVSFIIGVFLATLYLKIPFVYDGLGDITLWQWIKGDNPDEMLAWQDSWTTKKEKAAEDEKLKEQIAASLKEKEKKLLEHAHPQTSEQGTGVLCQCGQIVHVPMQTNDEIIECPVCGHRIRISKPG